MSVPHFAAFSLPPPNQMYRRAKPVVYHTTAPRFWTPSGQYVDERTESYNHPGELFNRPRPLADWNRATRSSGRLVRVPIGDPVRYAMNFDEVPVGLAETTVPRAELYRHGFGYQPYTLDDCTWTPRTSRGTFIAPAGAMAVAQRPGERPYWP